MAQAPPRWTWWRSLVSPLTAVCTRPGWVRFVPWGTGRGRGWEAPPIPQLWTALGLEACWRGLAHVAEEGAGAREAVEPPLRRMEQERPARWGRYHPLALDEAPRHRTSTQGGAPARFRRRAPAAPIVPRPGGRSTGARGGMGCPAGQGPRGRRPPVCTVGAASGLLGRRAAPRGGWRWRGCATRPPSRVRRAWP
jgi:hypothetical protein